MEKIDYKILAEQYEVEIQGWHLFYESFTQYEYAISVGHGVLIEMYSELNKAKKLNPDSEKIKKSESRLEIIINVLEKLQGLNSKCNKLQIKLKEAVGQKLNVEKENEDLKAEISALKASFND